MTDSRTPRIAIVMGSESDLPVMQGAMDILADFQIPCETRVLSAHRTPDQTAEFARTSFDRGVRVIIAGAGGAAHLAGIIAAYTVLPVIGVPVPSQNLKGLDSLLSVVQMPSGVPVASVAIGGSKNAALLAVQILATSDPELRARLHEFKGNMVTNVEAMDRRVREAIA